MRLLAPTLIACALALGAAATAAEPETMKVMMRDHINPAALDFWAGGNDPPEGETKAQARERWAAALEASKVLQDYGKKLEAAPLAGRWAEYAKLMAEVGAEGEAAAKAKDPEKAFAAGGRLYDSCAGCHNAYIPRRQEPLP
jgi:hypothetical protein